MRRWLVALISMTLIVAACGGGSADPAATIDGFVTAYNDDDLDQVMTFFSDESVLDGRPLENTEVFDSLAAIRSAFFIYMDFAVPGEAWTISNVQVDGDTVTWDQEYLSTIVDPVCGQGHRAVVADGKIVQWTWPTENVPCP